MVPSVFHEAIDFGISSVFFSFDVCHTFLNILIHIEGVPGTLSECTCTITSTFCQSDNKCHFYDILRVGSVGCPALFSIEPQV